MTTTAPRPVARARDVSPAEQVRHLLDELYAVVETRETVPVYRGVKRGPARQVLVLDWRTHVTRAPGLVRQLGILAGGQVGAAVPSGSPGWDEDGALSPLVSGSPAGSAEPVTDAWHVGREIDQAVTDLWAELREQGHEGTLVDIALADEQAGRRIAARLRSLVDRARVAAAYDAPVVPLRDVVCPECGGELRVRADASSDVRCAGSWTVEGPAQRGEPFPVRVWCGARWPRGGWVGLLEETTPDDPAEAVTDPQEPAHGPSGPVVAGGGGEVPAVLAGLIDTDMGG